MSQTMNKTLQEMEQNIALGFNPGCYKCGSTLNIKNQEGNDGSKGYYYSCTNKTECKLEDSFVKLSSLKLIKQAFLKKISIYALSIVGGSAILLGNFGNQLGLGKFFGVTKDTILVSSNDSINLALSKLRDENGQLKIKLSQTKSNAIEDTTEQVDHIKISFIEKYYLAMLYAGKQFDTKEIENSTNAKRLLFELVDKYKNSSEMTDRQAYEISLALAGLRHKADSASRLEIIGKLSDCRIDLDVKYLRQAEVYYVMGYNDNFYKMKSLIHYLKSASYKKLSFQSKDDMNKQINSLKQNGKLNNWNSEFVAKLNQEMENDNHDSIVTYIHLLEQQELAN